MTRERLPHRRAAETVELEHNGSRFTVTIGFYPDGRPGEVFTHGIRSGSNLDALLADACVVVSCLMQHGVEPSEIAGSMGRLGNAEPASIIGAVIDLAAAIGESSSNDRGGPHMTGEEMLHSAARLVADRRRVLRRSGGFDGRNRRPAGRSRSGSQSPPARWCFA